MAITLDQARKHHGHSVFYRSVATGEIAERGVIVGIGDRGLVLVQYGVIGTVVPTHPCNLDLVGRAR